MIKLYTENYLRLIRREKINDLDTLWTFTPANSYEVRSFKKSNLRSRTVSIACGLAFTVLMSIYIFAGPIVFALMLQGGFVSDENVPQFVRLVGLPFVLVSWVIFIYLTLLNITGLQWALRNIRSVYVKKSNRT